MHFRIAISSFAPQSGAYRMAHDLGSVEVGRGPGTRAIRSKPPLDSFTVNPYGTIGSFNTKLRVIEIDSGVIPRLGGARLPRL